MPRHTSNSKATTVVVASGALILTTLVANHALATPNQRSLATPDQGSVATASAAAKSTSDHESFLVTYGPHEHEVVIAHGVVTGGGKDIAGDSSDTLKLGNGSLRLNHPDGKSRYHQTLDPKTCYAAFTVTGPFTVGHGTGKYAGYRGHGTYKVSGEAIAQRTSTGACDQQKNPKVETAVIRASGTLHK